MVQCQDVWFALQQGLYSVEGFGQAFRAGSSAPRSVPFVCLSFTIRWLGTALSVNRCARVFRYPIPVTMEGTEWILRIGTRDVPAINSGTF